MMLGRVAVPVPGRRGGLARARRGRGGHGRLGTPRTGRCTAPSWRACSQTRNLAARAPRSTVPSGLRAPRRRGGARPGGLDPTRRRGQASGGAEEHAALVAEAEAARADGGALDAACARLRALVAAARPPADVLRAAGARPRPARPLRAARLLRRPRRAWRRHARMTGQPGARLGPRSCACLRDRTDPSGRLRSRGVLSVPASAAAVTSDASRLRQACANAAAADRPAMRTRAPPGGAACQAARAPAPQARGRSRARR